ncbi:SHIRT domain-containing protein [Streptococcus ovuberis]|uniref:YSIRK-type signal peptide-containing protein n=1 Tax=Streptococcus ovuberis TaxID=1936207 RepID=A0A7X6MY12_9STRE|nr:SHIRT domain-containing protein [Streptococcus ovuberis]NKZ19853.1 YSIRK-type signal peptide-containing protein [Streptococcus ovuberis]
MRHNSSAQSDKHLRFSIRKFNAGVASVAVAAFFMSGGVTVAASEAAANPALTHETERDLAATLEEEPTEDTDVQVQPKELPTSDDVTVDKSALQAAVSRARELDRSSLSADQVAQLDYLMNGTDAVTTQEEVDELTTALNHELERLSGATIEPSMLRVAQPASMERSVADGKKGTFFVPAKGVEIEEVDGKSTSTLPTDHFETSKPQVTNMNPNGARGPEKIHYNPDRHTFAVIYTANAGNYGIDDSNQYFTPDSGTIWFGDKDKDYYYKRWSKYTRVDQIAFSTDDNGSGKVYATYYSGDGTVVKEDVFEANVPKAYSYSYKGSEPFVFRYGIDKDGGKNIPYVSVQGVHPEGWFNELYTNYSAVQPWMNKNKYMGYGWFVPTLVDKTTEYVVKDTNKLLGSVVQTELSGYSYKTSAPKVIKANGQTYQLIEEEKAETTGTINPFVKIGDTVTVGTDYGYKIRYKMVDDSGTLEWSLLTADGQVPTPQTPTERMTGKISPGETLTTTAKVPESKEKAGVTYYISNPYFKGGKTTYYYKNVTPEKPAEKTGSVIAKFVDEKGTMLSGLTDAGKQTTGQETVKDANTALNTPYDASTVRPKTIKTTDDKTYYLYEKGTTGITQDKKSALEKGKVTEGETVITYVYKEPTVTKDYESILGKLLIKYVDESGNLISGTETGNKDTIVVEDDTVGQKTTTVTTDPNGREISKEVKDDTRDYPYDLTKETAVYRPSLITSNKDGKVYEYLEIKKGSAPEKGNLKPGESVITYVYKTRQSSVEKAEVIYEFVSGTEGKTLPESVKSLTPTKKSNVPYGQEVVPEQPSKTEIAEDDGTWTFTNYDKETELVDAPVETFTGTWKFTPKPVEKTGSVTVKFVDDKGQSLSGKSDKGEQVDSTVVLHPKGTAVDEDYDATAVRPQNITKDGKLYYLTEGVHILQPEGTLVNEIGKVVEGDVVITYTYKEAKKIEQGESLIGTLVVKYVDENGTPILGKETNDKSAVTVENELVAEETTTIWTTQEGKEFKRTTDRNDIGYSYDLSKSDEPNRPQTITVKANDGSEKVYDYVKVQDGSAPEKGELKPGETVVTYVYKERQPEPEQPKKATVTYNFVSGTPNKALPDEVTKLVPTSTTATYGDSVKPTQPTSTTVKVSDGTWTFTKYDKETELVDAPVETFTGTWVFTETPKENTPEQKGNIVIRYVKEGTNVEIEETLTLADSPVGSQYDISDYIHQTIETEDELGKRVAYVLVNKDYPKSDGVIQEGTTTYTYEYKETPMTHYISVVTNKSLATSDIGIKDSKTIDGYEFVETTKDEKGNVTHVYRPETPPAVKVITKHVDESGESVAPEEDGSQPSKTIDGYEFVKTTKDDKGNVTHVYKERQPEPEQPKKATVTHKFISGTPNKDLPNEVTKLVPTSTTATYGDSVKPTQPTSTTITVSDGTWTFTKYDKETELVDAPIETFTGTWVFTETPKEKTPEQKGNIVIRYVKEGTQEEIEESVTLAERPVGTAYDVSEYIEPHIVTVDEETGKRVAYVLVDKEYPDPKGVNKAGTITYTYEYKETPMTHYISEVTEKSIVPSEIGIKDSKEIKGYEFVKTTKDDKGNVTHVYRPVTPPAVKVITKHVDESGKPVAPEEDGSQPSKTIDGYEFVKTTKDDKGNVTHVYRPVTPPAVKVITKHVDESGKPVAPEEDGSQPSKTIDGYEFVKTTKDDKGNVTHVYRPVTPPAVKVITKHVDEPGKPTTPQEPSQPTVENQPVKATAPVKAVAQLPKTGQEESGLALVGAGVLALLGLAGLKRRKED